MPTTEDGKALPLVDLRVFRLLAALAFVVVPTVGLSGPVAAQDRAPAPPFSGELAAETFDEVWTRIAETHWDPELGGLDWDGVRDELRPRAVEAESIDELRQVLRAMLERLGESHFAILDGAAADVLPSGETTGDADPGLTLRLVDDQLLVTRVRTDGAADRAGIRPGWALTRVGDSEVQSLLDDLQDALQGREDRDRLLPLYLPSAVEARLRGTTGSEVEVDFRDADDRLRSMTLRRSEPGGTHVTFGNLGTLRVEVDVEGIATENGRGQIGLIRLSSWFPVIVPPVAEAIDAYRDAPGIIFDLRGNPGGVGGLVMGIAGHLLDEAVDLGELTLRESTLRFAVNPQRVAPDGRRVSPFGGPVAILVDGLSASTSEIFAGGLQSLGRARIFGEPTPGQALPALIVSLPTGDRLMHAIADYTVPDGTRLEGRGVLPDHPAPLTRSALLEGRDPALEAAIEWITRAPGPQHHQESDSPRREPN